MFRPILRLLVLGALPGACLAQPFNVRAWYAAGQVFVVWQFPAPPAAPTDTVEIYASAAGQIDTSLMTRVGRLFFPEYTGARLTALAPAARLLVPTPGGGGYRLAIDEGVFAFTPRQAGNLFFAVVDSGSTTVNAGNSAATAFNYDPINDPVRPHVQLTAATPAGHPYRALVVWAEGRDDYDNARPDFTIMGDADKNGVPHVFTITEPIGGVPAGDLSCLLALHGGGGEYQLFRPGIAARSNMSLGLLDGIVVTPDDSVYANVQSSLERSNTSWFGYTPEFDPFDSAARTNPADTAVVVNFTSRRVFWIIDWLLGPNSPYAIDAERIAIVGHSGGGRGTSVISRQQPGRFCAAVCYTPASDLSIEAQGRENFLRGDWDQNLDTNLIGPGGVTLRVTDVFTMTTRISPLQRDFALTRVVYGKRDEEGPASWSASQRALCDAFNDSRMGFMVFWDEREHGVEKWDTEESDAIDDPAHTNPWPDIGQWVAPIKTRRQAGQYLVDTYRRNQSYPGFFNADADELLAGRQPDPGPGDPDLGDPYGTWGGYFDWDTTTIEDDAQRWGCTVFCANNTIASIDDSPYAEIVADVIPRRTRFFLPPEGACVRWAARDLATGALLQSATSIAEAEGVVVVTGLRVPRDPDRVRLSIFPCLDGDVNCDGAVDFFDIDPMLLALFDAAAYAATYPGCDNGDVNNDGSTDFFDIDPFLNCLFNNCQ